MSTLLVVRHGQARLFTEDYDRLSEVGVRQAECLGEWLAGRGIVLDSVFAGSLRRQQQTANAVTRILQAADIATPDLQILDGLNEYPAEEILRQLVPILRSSDAEIDRLSREYDAAGDYKTRFRSLHQLLAMVMQRWISADYDNDISLLTWKEFSGGVRAALAAVIARTGSGKTVAVFTSGGPVGVSVQTTLNAPDLAAADLNWRVNNCSVTRFSFSGDRISLDAFNDTAHLEPDLLTYR
jgi:broad specificity phosphatase PhoE